MGFLLTHERRDYSMAMAHSATGDGKIVPKKLAARGVISKQVRGALIGENVDVQYDARHVCDRGCCIHGGTVY
jgi:hypothetical protein